MTQKIRSAPRVQSAPRVKTPKAVIFFSIVLVIYALAFFFSPDITKNAFWATLSMLYELIPILILVFFIMLGVNLYVKPERIKKHLGHESGWRGWLYAILAGILIAGPPYILFPLMADLKKSGMRPALLATLLYNRNVKLPFIPLMIAYFGLTYTIVISLYIILFSFVNGLLVEYFVEKK